MTQSIQKIRPSARLLKTIGRDLIKDVYAAIVELVKNAYDADSPNVNVEFSYNSEQQRLLIIVEDFGHGMDYDTVVNKWLVPATDDKLKRRRSEKGRMLQGRKGIGRFAASILGDRIFMETSASGSTTSLLLDMDELEKIEFLDQFELDIATIETDKSDGTRIEIETDGLTVADVRELWNPKQLHKLFVELRSLMGPEEVYKVAEKHGYKINHDRFDIQLSFDDFPVNNYQKRKIDVKPFPVLDLYDYKIFGRVDEEGNAILEFENQNIPALSSENIKLYIPIDKSAGQQHPGEIFIDLRVYDRDPDSVNNIIRRGLKDPVTGEYVGKMEARKILDEYYGVGVYREQFRVRPYGEQSFDWLDLDKKRVQNPSYKIGHNQIIGFVYIRPEEQSNLYEKSARDGLMENGAYFGLVTTVLRVINELEARRVNYREKAQKGGRARSLEDEMDSLFDFTGAQNKISSDLDKIDISQSQKESVKSAVNAVLEEEKQKKSAFVRKIRDTVAVYQGQATLGKITHVLLHEGRKHIKYLTETVPRVVKWMHDLKSKPDADLSQKIDDRVDKILSHTKGLSFLFKKIEPLARTRRSPRKDFNMLNEVETAFGIFSSELESAGITYTVEIEDPSVKVNANEIDLMTIFSNLIENSLFWLSQPGISQRHIEVHIFREENNDIVEFKDSGPGFQGGNLELLFEPGYSMKPDGTGIGLALAGEAVNRIGGKIEAKHSEQGAVFEIVFEGKENA